MFIDHAKEAYLSDLQLILRQRWLRPDALVVADNIKFPGAPDHRAYVEYQSVLKDLALVSESLERS